MKKRFARTTFESVDRYLDHCRSRLQSIATEFCNALDTEIKPTVFVIAVSCEKNPEGKRVNVSPGNFDYSWLDILEEKGQDLFSLAGTIEIDPVDFNPIAAKGFVEARFKQVANSIHRNTYASDVMMIEDFAVLAICFANSSPILDRHRLASKNEAVTSLIDGAFKEFLIAIPPYFYQAAQSGSILRRAAFPSSYEILRNAGKHLLSRISFRHLLNENLVENMPIMEKVVTFFDDLNGISRTKYESEQAIGRIAIGNKNHPNLELVLEFADPVRTHNLRASRKLLEMSNDEICLLYWNGDFYGLGQLTGEYNVEDENLFVIKIHGHYVWSLLHGDHTMMVVSHEQPRLYADEQTDYITEFHKALDLEFTDNSLINKEQLTELFKIALKQLHGTMLVIVGEAQEESKRLRTQSTQIIPSLVSETLMRTITAIDGAVILDPKGICYSIGVILDGVVEEGKGDPARGARLNAAFNYLSYCKRKGSRCLLTVISEDGMVNIFFTQQDKSSQN